MTQVLEKAVDTNEKVVKPMVKNDAAIKEKITDQILAIVRPPHYATTVVKKLWEDKEYGTRWRVNVIQNIPRPEAVIMKQTIAYSYFIFTDAEGKITKVLDNHDPVRAPK